MAAVLAYAGMLLTSIIVAFLAALQLGDYFGAEDEFAWVLLVIVAFAAFALAVLAAVTQYVSALWMLNASAALLASGALIVACAPGLASGIAAQSTNPYTAGHAKLAATLEIAVGGLSAVLVQWGLVRRRFLRRRGDDDFSRWPWVTTVVAGLVILSPLGLDILGGAMKRSATDWFWRLWIAFAVGAGAVLVVIAATECYIRRRMLRRRSQRSPS